MNMEPVNSSQIKSVWYEEDQSVLAVEFFNWWTYNYFNISKEIYEALMGAPSPWGFLASNIKGKFPYVKVW